jgi:hypothetical protein
MTIYQVVYYNQFGDRVADFGYYVDRLDAEKRAFEIRIKTSPESGEVCIEDVFVHESSAGDPPSSGTRDGNNGKKRIDTYGLKS